MSWRSALGYSFALLAAALALMSTILWVVPQAQGPAQTALVIGFLVNFIGFGAVMVARRDRAKYPETALAASAVMSRIHAIPRHFRWMLGVSFVAALTFGVAGLISTSGFSTNSIWTLPGCKWSLVTNHGLTNICVTYRRWLTVGDGVLHGILGFLSLFSAIEAIAVLPSTATT